MWSALKNSADVEFTSTDVESTSADGGPTSTGVESTSARATAAGVRVAEIKHAVRACDAYMHATGACMRCMHAGYACGACMRCMHAVHARCMHAVDAMESYEIARLSVRACDFVALSSSNIGPMCPWSRSCQGDFLADSTWSVEFADTVKFEYWPNVSLVSFLSS